MNRHPLRSLALVLAILAANTPLRAQEAASDLADPFPADPNVKLGSFANGLRYYIRENPEPQKRAELRLVVNAGSVLEDDDQLGLAHFVEHMAFNGTKHFEKQELADYLERIGMRFGADVNAYTSFDETVYILQVPTDSPQIVATAFQILEDWARYQTFDHEEIDKERGVVIEEWRRGQGASARMRDKQWPILFKDSRYAERLPIGKTDILESFDYDVPKRFYREWYRPDLMAVIAVGDFEKSTIEELIRTHFEGIPATDNPRERTLFPVPDHEETLFAIATDKESTFSSVSVYYKQALRDQSTIGAYRQSIVERLYNGMLNDRFFELTQLAHPPFLGAGSGQGRFIGGKEVYFLGARVEDSGIELGLETLLKEAERVARYGFAASELERQKRESLRGIRRVYDEREKTHSGRYASEYVRNFLFDEPIPGIEYEYELYQRFVPGIQLQEVNGLAREWITDENRVILVNAPEKESVSVPSEEGLLAVFAAVAAAEITAYEDTPTDAPLIARVPAAAPIVEEAEIEEIGVKVLELDNGVRVLLKPTDFKDDEIVFNSWSPGGTSLAPDQQYLSAFMADALISQGGVGEFNLVDLQKVLTGKAVSVFASIGSLSEGMSGRASPADVETLFQLIYLYFTAPRRDSTAFLSFKSRLQASLANRSVSPEGAFQDTLQVTLSQYHYRTRPISSELLEEMDLDVSYAFYKDRFADASDFTFVFVGAFDPDSLKPLVQTYLGNLPSIGREETWVDVGIDPPTGVIRKTVRKGIEPKSRTQIVFTGPFEWTRENRYALRSLSDVLRIKLREVLREDLGGTYGVGVSGSSARDPDQEYSFRISFGADPERLEELTEVVFQQIDSLRTHGPTQEYIDKVKETQRRSRETNLRRNGYWLGRLSAAVRHGTDPRNILDDEKFIDGLTAEMIRAAAEMYLRTDNYVQVSLFPESPETSSNE